MRVTFTIARRELSSLFFSPIAYVVLGLFAFGTSLFFLGNFAPGRPAEMRQTFFAVIWLLVFLAPAISMRLISEEFRSGAIELLTSAPLTDAQVILGKWLGAMGFFAVLMSPLVVQALLLEVVADPEWGPILCGLLGVLLVGGLYLAIGAFASALTQNQIIAFLITITLICSLTILLYYLPQVSWMPLSFRAPLQYANVNSQYESFSKGLLAVNSFVYFLTATAMFLFLAVKMLESRRWR